MGPKCNHKRPWKREAEGERLEDATPQALKMEEENMSQRIQGMQLQKLEKASKGLKSP